MFKMAIWLGIVSIMLLISGIANIYTATHVPRCVL